LRSFFERIGSRDAINWLTVLVISATQFLSTMFASGAKYDDRFSLFIACNLAAIVALAICLGIGALVMHKFAAQKPKPVLAISIIFVADFVRSYIFDSLLIRYNFSQESHLAYRFFGSIFAMCYIFLLFAYFIESARDVHRRNQDLAAMTAQLNAAKAASLNDLEIYRQNLFAEIRGKIGVALSEVRNQTSKHPKDLERIIDEVIRPSSYDLYKKVPSIGKISEGSASGGFAWKDVVGQLISNRPFQRFLVPGCIGLAIGLFIMPVFKVPSLPGLILLVACAFCLLSFADLMWSRCFQSASFRHRRALYFSITLVFATIISSAVASLLPASVHTLPTYISLWSAATTITILPGFVVASIKLQAKINLGLNAITSALQSELVSINLLKFQFQKNAARLIHGPIQDLVAMTVMRLVQTSGELTIKDIQHLNAQIENVWGSVNKSERDAISLNDYLQNLVEMWDVQAEIVLNFDLDEVEIISTDQNASMAIQELVREACSNSIRHGKATSIDVNLHLNQETMSVLLTVCDNGIGFEVGTKTGLGTQMFDDFTISWETISKGGKTTVTAEIPFTKVVVK